MTMFVCEKCGKETPSNESYISEDGFRICEECARNTNAIKDEYIEIEEAPEETQNEENEADKTPEVTPNEENEADKAEQEPVKSKKLTKKEKKIQKVQERREEEKKEREAILQANIEYADNHGMYPEELSYQDILDWNAYNTQKAAGAFAALDRVNYGYNEDVIRFASKVLAHNSEILIRQNEVIIRLLKGLYKE